MKMLLTKHKTIRTIAFYLPQYHPIPENDRWWGKGFTEWANVTKARPLFPGHYQPHLPGELGFYDLRVPEVRKAQADLAREYGIDGFCYYHYWFHGKRLLERPFNEVLESGEPDFPFCLCWANENWTRKWDGLDEEHLIRQTYSQADDREHIRWLMNAFRDSRYIRLEGKPLMIIYRATDLPNPLRTTTIWREECRRNGVGEIFLCNAECWTLEYPDPQKIGFDASVEFQPNSKWLGSALRRGDFWRLLRALGISSTAYRENQIYQYASIVENALQRRQPSYRRFSCVTPSWDNSARRRSGSRILIGSSPELYEKWLRSILKKELEAGAFKESLIFINAWNEWAEGNYLEPDQKFGRVYLEATRRALSFPQKTISPREQQDDPLVVAGEAS